MSGSATEAPVRANGRVKVDSRTVTSTIVLPGETVFKGTSDVSRWTPGSTKGRTGRELMRRSELDRGRRQKAATSSVRSTGASLIRTRGKRPRVFRCRGDRKSTRLNSSHVSISYAVFCLKNDIVP